MMPGRVRPLADSASAAIGRDLERARGKCPVERLARAIGRSPDSVRAFERGERQLTVRHVEQVLRATGKWGP